MYRPGSRQKGLTMIELLVAISLTSIVITGAFAMIHSCRTASNKAKGLVSKHLRKRLVITAMQQEIKSIVQYDSESENRTIERRTFGGGFLTKRDKRPRAIFRSDVLGFVSTVSILASDISNTPKWICYYVDKDPETPEKGLVMLKADAITLVGSPDPVLTQEEQLRQRGYEAMKDEYTRLFPDRFLEFKKHLLENGGEIYELDRNVLDIKFKYISLIPTNNEESDEEEYENNEFSFWLPGSSLFRREYFPYAIKCKLIYKGDNFEEKNKNSFASDKEYEKYQDDIYEEFEYVEKDEEDFKIKTIEIYAQLSHEMTISTQEEIEAPGARSFFGR